VEDKLWLYLISSRRCTIGFRSFIVASIYFVSSTLSEEVSKTNPNWHTHTLPAMLVTSFEKSDKREVFTWWSIVVAKDGIWSSNSEINDFLTLAELYGSQWLIVVWGHYNK
jgi:hypothetical protein